TIKWFLVGCKKYIEWPAAVHAHGLNSLHIHMVNIRAFFTIYFDAHKKLIHDRCDIFMFERLALHHMAPMARRVPDTDKDRFVFLSCFGQGFFTPLIPINRIVRML